MLGKKLYPVLVEKNNYVKLGLFCPIFGSKTLFALFSESALKIFLKFFAMIGEYFKQVTRVNI